MKALKTKTLRFFIPILALSLVLTPLMIQGNAFADYAVCSSDACKAAQAAENELRQKANDAVNEAQTVEGEVAKLDAEIAAIQANIDTSVAMVNELKEKIKETEERLDNQQTGLASLLVQMHLTMTTIRFLSWPAQKLSPIMPKNKLAPRLSKPKSLPALKLSRS